MYEMTAYCGLDCSECKAFKATHTNDFELKKQMAERWSSQGDVKFKPEDIDCRVQVRCDFRLVPKTLQDKTMRCRKEGRYLCSL